MELALLSYHIATQELSFSLSKLIFSLSYSCYSVFQMIRVHIRDTNNHPPTFIYEDNLDEFIINIAAPLAPGYEVTSRASVTVRDVDLTTDKIIFRIQENAYFEIEEEILRNDNTPKQFQAIIRTKTFIRSFPERLSLTIWATVSSINYYYLIFFSFSAYLISDKYFQQADKLSTLKSFPVNLFKKKTCSRNKY